MRFFVLIVIFLLIGAFFIISNENLHLSRDDEAYEFGEKYYSWIFGFIGNGAKMAGYVVNSGWLPDFNETLTNSSFVNKSRK